MVVSEMRRDESSSETGERTSIFDGWLNKMGVRDLRERAEEVSG